MPGSPSETTLLQDKPPAEGPALGRALKRCARRLLPSRLRQWLRSLDIGFQTAIAELARRERRIVDLESEAGKLRRRIEELDGRGNAESRDLHYFREYVQPFVGVGLPVILERDAYPAVLIERAPVAQPVVVITTPKSGTYLWSKILAIAGFGQTYLHLSESLLSDYRDKSFEEMRRRYKEFTRVVPLKDSIHLIKPGQFAVGHLRYTPESIEILGDSRVVFSHRELRQSLVSHMRFYMLPGRGGEDDSWKRIEDERKRMAEFLRRWGEEIISGSHRPLIGWKSHHAAYTLRFEEALGDFGTEKSMACIGGMLAHAGVRLQDDQVRAILQQAIGSETQTYSGARSTLDPYWSDEAEQLFRQFGGQEVNEAFGYRDAWGSALDNSGLVHVRVTLPDRMPKRSVLQNL